MKNNIAVGDELIVLTVKSAHFTLNRKQIKINL